MAPAKQTTTEKMQNKKKKVLSTELFDMILSPLKENYRQDFQKTKEKESIYDLTVTPPKENRTHQRRKQMECIFEKVLNPSADDENRKKNVSKKEEQKGQTMTIKKRPIYADALKSTKENYTNPKGKEIENVSEKIVNPTKTYINRNKNISKEKVNKNQTIVIEKRPSYADTLKPTNENHKNQKGKEMASVFKNIANPLALDENRQKNISINEEHEKKEQTIETIEKRPINADALKLTNDNCNFASALNFSEENPPSPNYGKEMEKMLRSYCVAYQDSMSKKRQKLDAIAFETVKENELQVEKLAKRQMNERRVSRREFETSIADQIRECRNRIDEDEKKEFSFMEQMKKQHDTMKNSRQTLLEKVSLIKNSCQNYVKVLDEMDEKHNAQFDEVRVMLRNKLTALQDKTVNDSQRAELLNMRESLNGVFVSPTFSNES